MSQIHSDAHGRIEQRLRALEQAVGAIPAPTPTPAPTPAPAPSGDAFNTYGSLPSPMTLTRASIAHSTTAPGTVFEWAVDDDRYDGSPVDGNLLGLLLEGPMTNELPYSESPGGTGWTNIGAGVTRTTGRTDPKGGTNAVRLQAAAGDNGIFGQVLGLSGYQTARMWAKSNTGSALTIRWRDMPTNSWVEVVVPTTWTPLTTYGLGTTFFNFSIIAGPSAALDVDVWCAAVIETSSTSPSDIPNSGSGTTTRAGDVISIPSGLTNGARDIRIVACYGYADATPREFWIRNVTVSGNAHSFNATDIENFPGSLRVQSITYYAAGTAPAPTPTPPPVSTPGTAPVPSTPPGYIGKLGAAGDSQTIGDTSNVPPIYAPGDAVKTGLAAAGYTFDYAGIYSGVMSPGGWDVTAQGGWTIANLQAQAPAVGALGLDYLSINISTNDLASSTPRPTIGTEYVAMLDAFEAECGEIPIFVFMPVNPGWFNIGNFTLIKSAAANWCAAKPTRRYHDLSLIGMSGSDFNGDGTHYSSTGAQKVADAMVAAMLTFLQGGADGTAPTPAPPSTVFADQMLNGNEGWPIFYMENGRDGFNPTSSKYCGGFVYRMGEGYDPPYMRPWLIFMPEDNGVGGYNYASAPNSLLELSWLRVYRNRGGTGWTKIFERKNPGDWFEWYDQAKGAGSDSYTENAKRPLEVRAYTSNGKLLVPANGFIYGSHVMFHGGSGETWEFQSGDWLSMQIQVRMILGDPNGVDDRVRIPIIGDIGADRTTYPINEYFHGSYLRVPNDGSYRLITATNISTPGCSNCSLLGGPCGAWTGAMSAAQLNANPPPIPTFGS